LRFLAYVVGAHLIIGIPSNFLGIFLEMGSGVDGQMITIGIAGITGLILLVFYFIFAIQRSHDMNNSGWLSLILFIPIIGFLVFLFAPGTHGANRYGAPPPPNGVGVILLAFIMPVIGFIGILAAIAIPAYNGYINAAKEAQQVEQQSGPQR